MPPIEIIPQQFRALHEWYKTDYMTKQGKDFQMLNRYTVNPEFARIDEDEFIKIPKSVMEKLQASIGDYVAFVEYSSGAMLIKKASFKIML